MKIFLTSSISLLFLVACTSNSNTSNAQVRSEGHLIQANESSLSAYFQEALKQDGDNLPSDISAAGSTASESALAMGSAGAGSGFSGTNLQENGVDEADLLKTDGRYIYSIDTAEQTPVVMGPADETIAASPRSHRIRVMDSEGGLTPLKPITNLVPESRLSGLYLTEDSKRLIALASQNGNYWGNWFYPYYFAKQNTDLLFIDVKDPSKAALKTELHFDGALISSRLTDNTLYMVLRHYPQRYPTDTLEAEDKNLTLDTEATANYLPSYSINQEERQPVVASSDCYLQPNATHTASIVTLVAIDVHSLNPTIHSQCFIGSTEALYASTKALYLATTRYDYRATGNDAVYDQGITTDIHKFAFNTGNLEYRGSAEVRGHLGWNQDQKSFRFSEKDGLLRVLTFAEDLWNTGTVIGNTELPEDVPPETLESPTTSTSSSRSRSPTANKSPVLLTILEEDTHSTSLKQLAQLPNKARPEPIGLAKEKLYASRFIGDRGYLVTFRVTDPLYILDLSDPTDPYIAGALKVEGYSDYLHPISENLLLGIGKDAIPDTNESGRGDGRGAWYQGVKLSLIDVSDPTNPREADKIVLGKRGTEATVLRDHHGLSGLQTGDTYRVALPISIHDREGSSPNAEIEPWSYYNYTKAGLYRFNIDIANQTLNQIEPLIISNYTQNPRGLNVDNDRSIIIDDDIHYLHGGQFWSQDWPAHETASGPQ
jgi:uncharacterized secreted protein with C-terminal beta-propeller domain